MQIHPVKILGVMLFFTGLALCGAGLWILFSPPQFCANAKVNVMASPDEKNRPGIYYDDSGYDPFFVVNADTEIRTMVLTNVIATQKLDASLTARMLSRRVKITPERKIGIAWTIQVTEENPDEAMQLANAIAKSYADYGVTLAKFQNAAGLQTLEKEYTNEEIQISTLQTKAAEKRKFNNLVELHKLVGAKIEALKTDLRSNQYSSVRIVSLAVMPTTPSGPNRFLATVLVVIGFFVAVSGIFVVGRAHFLVRFDFR
jgi:capsular polysaccharide biosynthesis protein